MPSRFLLRRSFDGIFTLIREKRGKERERREKKSVLFSFFEERTSKELVFFSPFFFPLFVTVRGEENREIEKLSTEQKEEEKKK